MTREQTFPRRKISDVSSSADTRRLALLFVPLVLQVILLRLLETTMLRRGALAPVEDLLWTNAPLPFLNLLIGAATFWVAKSKTTHLPTVVPATAATAVTALASALSYRFAPWWIREWVTPTTLEVLRWDLLLVLGALSTAVLFLTIGGYRTRFATRAVTHLVVPAVMTLSAAGFGYFLATGSPADWQILKYGVGHIAAVRELVAGTVKGHHIILVLLPWMWSAGVWGLTGRKDRSPHYPSRLRPSAVLALSPVMLLLGLAPSQELTPSVQSGSLHRIVKMAAADAAGGGASVRDIGPAGRPDFDALNLRFDRSDSTHTPNIVMILMESVRHRSTTPYNPDLRTMPFLDSLANEGIIVEDMTAVVSYTNKSLVPIYAGIFPRPGRDLVEATPGAIPATGLPTLLAPLGYRNAFFTSATMEFERKDVILENLGFTHMVGADELDTAGFQKKAYFGFEDRAILEPALDWVRETSRAGHPFFLNLLTLTSHHPYDVPDSFATSDFGTPNRELNAYYNSLRYTDDFLRTFLRAMANEDLMQNTVFIILGDHGEAFQEHMEKTHGNVIWDEALRVPAILYGPGVIPAGRTIRGARQHIDLLPTIADLLNVTVSGGLLPGTSIFADVSSDRTLYHHSLDDRRVMALRRDSLKFIYFYKQTPSRVYNYLKDPDERHDLASRITAEELSRMELELLLWRKRVTSAYPDRRRVRLYPKTLADSTNVASQLPQPPAP
jgi:arylsulfatase A-like enzyme